MLDKISKLLKKYREILLYCIVGGGTTVINLGAYYLFSRICSIQYLVSNVLAWITSFLFAFLANKIWVFENRSFERSVVIKEVVSFFSARVATGLLDMALLALFVDVIRLSDLVAKIIDLVITTIINYGLSKWIFKRKSENTAQDDLTKTK